MRCAVFALSIFLAVIGNYRAEEASEFTLAEKTFHGRDFEVKMLDSGVAEIYVEGRLLATTYTDLEARGVFQFSQPEITSDANNRELKMVFRQKKDTLETTCVRKLKAVKGALELTTELSSSDSITSFDVPLRITAEEYDGGTCQLGPEGLLELTSARTGYFSGEDKICCMYPPDVSKFSFWQKDKKAGFSVSNIKGNEMLLANWWDGWWQEVKPASPKMHYTVRMYSDGDKKIQRVTQSIAPAYRTADDILTATRAAHVKVDFPAVERYGYIPVGCRFPVQITIGGSKETAGSYAAEFLLLDQTDREVMKKAMSFDVTETEEGKATFDLITLQQCALYWMRISLKDKNGSLLYSKEYPFAVIAKLPELKDIPATSPLGGQPLAGGRMPEGRFVGMKWDRFWDSATSWNGIELEKGKFNWEKCDQLVEEAVKAGNEILWCLCRTPKWASKMPQEKVYDAIAAQYPVAPILKANMAGTNGRRISYYTPPKDIKDWENFVRTIVRRYKTKVHYWQIWNEPWWDRKNYGKPVGDLIIQLMERDGKVADADPWGFCGTMEDYASLVKSASKIIREEDPAGKVVVYGDYLARDGMDEFYRTGVGDSIDVLCMHYFCFDYLYSRKRIPGAGSIAPVGQHLDASVFSASNNVAAWLDDVHFKHTGRHVPIWDTEECRGNCAFTKGRIWPRPLTQKQCEDLFGDNARILSRTIDGQPEKSMMSERLNSVWSLQMALFGMGAGLDKIFMHCGWGVSIPSGRGQAGYKLPFEKGIAWAAMASVLSTFSKVEYSPMGSKELDAVTITDISGKKTAVIWSHTGERKIPVAIPVGRGKVLDFLLRVAAKALPSLVKSKDRIFKGMDWLGSPMELKSKDGWLTIEVSEEPLYIHDLDLKGIFIGDRSFLSIKGEKDIEAIEIGKPYCGEIIVGNPYYAGRDIDCVLEASVKPGGKVMIEGERVRLAPGEQKTVPFNITSEKEEEIRVEFKLKEHDLELTRLEKTYRMARHVKGTPLSKCPQGMKVDGKSGDWEGIAGQKVDTADRVLVGLEMPVYEKAPVRIWQGPSDLSFSVKSCWREDGVYFLVDVNDNEITPGSGPSYQWDCVEFFVDMRDAAGQSKKEKTSGAVQFSVQPSLGDQPQECKIAFVGNDGKYAKALFMGRKTKTGYMVEGRVEPAGIQLKEGMMIGLDVAVDDGKEPNPGNKEERKSQMVWMGTEDNYRDTSKWGKFYLAK